MPTDNSKYDKVKEERKRIVDSLLTSSAAKKIVVAGPGTGKTFLFKKILESKTNTLTLTFVNSLVEDLSLELCGISDVKTLHGYSRSILKKILKADIKISPMLTTLIKEDAKIILDQDIDFEKIFHNREDNIEHLKFYEERRKYYDYYGYADVVSATVNCFEKDKNNIPSYSQIVVDEFQDFNKLEVSLIDLLSEKSPILLAGDDDQALYDFKHASAEYIREKHSDKIPEYETFNLPFCARCPRVVVEATNDLIESAHKNGLLKDRINKPYIYFDDKDKDKISEQYPKIIHKLVFSNIIPWQITQSIEEIATDLKEKFSVLIISPYKKQSMQIVKSLREKGLLNIDFNVTEDEIDISLLEGFNILLSNKTDNLAWRIVAPYFFRKKEDFVSLINASVADPSKKISDLLPKDIVKSIKDIIKSLKYISKGKPITPDLLASTLSLFKIDPNSLAINLLQEKCSSTEQNTSNPIIRKIPIKATTIQSSKGLSADIVIITHFDDQYFIKGLRQNILSDQDICNFIVALTRTKKKVFLFSSTKKTPLFLKMIKDDRIDKID